ncbi:MAG: 23S rRNA (uracil(1939)-C(5))-methyltransferase RlmD [Alphaproteobacteria bacterium]|nr:23S rRNA (uracil(1939)-C(5))-methyltransferase RlmD [Alphaproteobacteria bacterium]
MTDIDVTIKALGAKGDGVAETDGGAIFVPFAAPGDLVNIRVNKSKDGRRRGKVLSVTEAGPDRHPAACEHFTQCGGCSVQHLTPASYQSWKREIVCQALKRQNLDTAIVANLITGSVGERRRARLSARRLAGGTILGFFEMGSHRIVNLEQCPVLHSDITSIFPALRSLLDELLEVRSAAEVAVTRSDTGLDITLLMPGETDLTVRETLATFAETNDVARISWKPLQPKAGDDAEPIVARRSVAMKFGDIQTEIPPDAFIQPTSWGEQVLCENVMAAVNGADKVVELFAGCGAFALPIAMSGSQVFAVDLAQDHLGALSRTARSNGLGERIKVEARNLDRRPLAGPELDGLDVVVLDPPRAGASAQAGLLANSAIPTIVYISCNPQSFARDARKLIDGGYELESVLPIDQFLWSPHVELVSVFRSS